MCNIFLACEPLAGKRMVKVTERKTKRDWACFLEEIANQYNTFLWFFVHFTWHSGCDICNKMRMSL
jgi:hypothetical protein